MERSVVLFSAYSCKILHVITHDVMLLIFFVSTQNKKGTVPQRNVLIWSIFTRLVEQILKHMQITASFAIPPLMHPRQKRLQTFTNTKATRKKLKHIDRDLKTEQMCMNKQLVMLASGEQLSQDCGSKFIPRPCALV